MKFGLKKSVGGLSDNAIALVVVAVTIGIGATILANVQSSQVTGVAGCNATAKTLCPTAYNASEAGLASLGTFSTNLNTLALVIIFGIILFFLGRFLVRR